ncbi:restriction endonuclease subunit S [Clostridium estertheticum]|uniref:restriction endonuclease subunit S n=1 Tax=Clostridium TaxID=1485 RepID=UPI001C0AEE93|nr:MULTISPECIES: restriction endonuclease subunit S [Clostridium]MBU3146508.1 restriction endonuclease subunit S [Clostridium sp. CF012]MBU3179139.1 restriction endonuclease subunit S [Clostridium estertheticum]
MALTRYAIGELIELTTETNENLLYGEDDVRGMTITKQIIPTKANVSGADLSKFLVVQQDEFVYNPRTHGKKIGLGFNDTDRSFIISWNNISFKIKEDMGNIILPKYLFLHFNRTEWDREACYRSWGSSTEVFSWEALCDIEIELPSIPIQQKFVDVYNAMLANQCSYEKGLEDLKLVCDGYVDDLRRKIPCEKIGNYIQLSEDRNKALKYGVLDVRGISIEKRFIETKADMQGVGLKPYYVINPDEFAYVSVTSRNGEKISLAHNGTEETYICSSSYIVFRTENTKKIYPKYLEILFSRSEFDRYARFNSWGSARETFNWEDMCDVKIPIPDMKIQHAIADIYTAYITRKKINEKLKARLKDLCPILIKGSLEEGIKS